MTHFYSFPLKKIKNKGEVQDSELTNYYVHTESTPTYRSIPPEEGLQLSE